MKSLLVSVLHIAVLFLSVGPLVAQANFKNCDPNTFWTIGGHIREWRLENGVITGGEIIVEQDFQHPVTSLAMGQMNGERVLFGAEVGTKKFKYYDEAASTWKLVEEVNSTIANCGGNRTGVFCQTVGDYTFYYYNGTELSLIEDLWIGSFEAADLIVDDKGWCYAMLANGFDLDLAIEVYDSTGTLQNSYDFDESGEHVYGGFIINDVLYYGIGSSGSPANSIVPLLLDDDTQTASFGDPIPFPNNSYQDMASCISLTVPTNVSIIRRNQLMVFPQPAQDVLHLNLPETSFEIQLLDVHAQVVRTWEEEGLNLELEINSLPNGWYVLRVRTGKRWMQRPIVIQR